MSSDMPRQERIRILATNPPETLAAMILDLEREREKQVRTLADLGNQRGHSYSALSLALEGKFSEAGAWARQVPGLPGQQLLRVLELLGRQALVRRWVNLVANATWHEQRLAELVSIVDGTTLLPVDLSAAPAPGGTPR